MDIKELGSIGGNVFTYILAAVQSNEVLQVIEFVFSVILTLVILAYRVWKWWREAKKDGKITEEEYKAAKEEYEKYSKEPWQETDDPLADFKANTKHGSVLERYEGIIERYEDNLDYFEQEIHLIGLGEIAFVFTPYELYIDFQHRIQARSPFIQTFMVQLSATTAGIAGYLCTERAAYNMGYSAIIYSCNVSPKGGDTFVEKSLAILHQIKDEN